MLRTNNSSIKKSFNKEVKRASAILLACVVSLSSIGCGSKKKEDNNNASQQVTVESEEVIDDVAVSEEVDEMLENTGETEPAVVDTDANSDNEKASETLIPTADIEEKTDTDNQNELEEDQNIAVAAVEDINDADDIADLKGNDQTAQDSDLDIAAEQSTEEIDETSTGNDRQDENVTEDNEVLEDEITQEDTFNDISVGSNALSLTQRNSINMLNYMTVIAQEINASKGNQLRLESIYSSLYNNIYPNAVDVKTQAQITNLMDTIESFRMIAVKRERLNFIYEQNRAQALRQAIPNPVALLSAVQSGNLIKAAASVLYMAIDAKASYDSARTQADLQFVRDGWELDDSESAALHNSAKNRLTYMLNMVRDYDLPGDLALNEEAVTNFVLWAGKPESQIVGKIAWLEKEQETYANYGPYWLELANDYYITSEYGKCLEAIENYESVSTRIFRKDYDYAKALPMAIVSAKETFTEEEYVATAAKYCEVILDNTRDSDWSYRYFVAQIYLDLYASTKDTFYLDSAYKIAFDNVVVLVDEQRELNSAYLADVQEVTVDRDATDRQKEEAKQYNKIIKEERKVALPPVSEALYLNCDLLFSLAEIKNVSSNERARIDAILHENGNGIFLTEALDARFWFDENVVVPSANEINIEFDGEKIVIPATCITDRSKISATIQGLESETKLEDWIVTNVKRPKNASCSEFTVVLNSETGKKYKYQAGEKIIIKIIPVEESPEEFFEFTFDVIAVKNLWFIPGIDFERTK